MGRRSRPRPAAAPPAAAPPAAAKPLDSKPLDSKPLDSKPLDYTHHSTAKPAPAAAQPAPAGGSVPAPRPVIDFSRPGRAAAAVVPAQPAAPVRPSAAGPTPAARHTDSLDLSDAPAAATTATPTTATPATATPATAAAVHGPVHEALPRYRGPRIKAGQQLLLGVETPAATLTRVQSGVGRLTVQAICSPDIGDLRLGALYQLRSGGTSTVQLAGGNRFAPSSRRPVIIASREDYDQLAIDLRQIHDVQRVSVYAFSESRSPLNWGGTLVVTTFGGARLELPLETLPSANVAMLVSLYNVHGELVVRTELETIEGDVREAARAYGYDRITWRDDRSPVD